MAPHDIISYFGMWLVPLFPLVFFGIVGIVSAIGCYWDEKRKLKSMRYRLEVAYDLDKRRQREKS